MKGLRLYLPPFAPDTSGAAAVLYPLGGMVVIVDAGGCAGNICGFDEPRWQEEGAKSAVFSAGLRDMDAIMGRDDKLIEKVRLACEEIEPQFIAFIGTPVPAVIGTDYRALTRMAKKATGLPAIAVDSDGTKLYDAGGGKALLALCRAFAKGQTAGHCGTIGLLGLTPLDFSAGERDRLADALREEGWSAVCCYDRLTDFTQPCCRKNLVVSPLGLPAARFLAEHCGIPYEIGLPGAFLNDLAAKIASGLAKEDHVLIIHQQVLAGALRRALRQGGHHGPITCATFFEQPAGTSEPGDAVFREEDEFQAFVAGGRFTAIVGDPSLRRALPSFGGRFLALPHFAVSGTTSAS
ncbi:nitrogenase molybdenum-iron protein [Mitsuokella sp. AF33-22]|uniref:nitrogenase component 1 n=1 Tax=Mitsuokella sp. AF33-22 TaxID=2292047 RepID=UPI000E4CE722|nr:nitrogenase component 1 [Mitsuokella sp. AF33-22]RHM56463.1 nitrogenase molybdenum-iron protein [Mitsuokella sp. AF33-22]